MDCRLGGSGPLPEDPAASRATSLSRRGWQYYHIVPQKVMCALEGREKERQRKGERERERKRQEREEGSSNFFPGYMYIIIFKY